MNHARNVIAVAASQSFKRLMNAFVFRQIAVSKIEDIRILPGSLDVKSDFVIASGESPDDAVADQALASGNKNDRLFFFGHVPSRATVGG
jgi:hypothetical protein